MTWLVAIGLTNAAMASVLACIAWGIGRSLRRPALTRLLWLIVLCKLLAPPLAKAPPTWLAVPSRWLGEGTGVATVAEATNVTREATVTGEPTLVGSTATIARQVPGASESGSATASTQAIPVAKHDASTAVHGGGLWQAAVRRVGAVSPAGYLRATAVIWILGSAVSLVWFAWRSWRFHRFLAHAGRHDAELSLRVTRLAKEAGLRSSPRVLVVQSAVSPMLWGPGRSARLLFPAALARRISDEARDALLLHELAHYARGDWLVRVLELAVQVVFWWHPLVGWARREIEAAEEECCDAWVVSRQSGSRRAYAEALLTALDFLCEPVGALPPAACGLGEAPLLRSRLTQIMCGEVAIRPSRAAKAIVLAGAAVVLPWGPAFVSPSPEAAARDAAIVRPETDAFISTAMTQSAAAAETDAEPAHELTPATDSQLESRAGNWFIARTQLPVSPVLDATAVSPNGKHKLEHRTGYAATLIDIESGSHLDLSSYRILSASFSPDSRRLVTAQDDDNVVRLWDCNSGELLARLTGSDVAVKCVAFAPDGTRVAAGADDGSVVVWDLNDREQVARLPEQDAPVSCLRWSNQGDRLAIALSTWSNHDSASLLVWRPGDSSGLQRCSLEQSVGAIDWLTADEMVVADWSGAAKTIDLTTGQIVENQWLGKDTISAAAFSPDCPLLPRWQAGRLARVGN
ncbi:MAG TPA: M56 family metallopeptidase [Pirellulales bacterium]|jgi:beta-lactamase regulating signal transducer with metallopeptidase domain|nr:M56 family metallopeptidase [Pirellulales bacterium]